MFLWLCFRRRRLKIHILFYILAGVVFAYWLFGVFQPRYNRPKIFWKPIGVFSVLIVAVLFAWVGYLTSSPNNFDECIAKNIKHTPSEDGARAIYMACKGLFPEKKYESFEQCVNEKQREKTLQELQEEREGNIFFRSSVYINPESDCKKYFPATETKNYYKCILKNMKGSSTDVAARANINQCREKFLKD